MISVTKLFLILTVSFINNVNSLSLSDNRIKDVCQRNPRKKICLKFLKNKRENLMKGNQIEIPVIPFKK